ncbi:MAG TPA: VWA domain-containing protein, partial [Thermoanaerobaculia bacterium]|nr:VWA domain-containing protein [Thermoanaerobaculia bacterium]
MRRATCLLLIAGCLGWAAGHALSAQQKQFGETVEIVTVEVPVQVLRDGEPVRGLTAEDFEILEGRRPQPITGFEVIDLSLMSNAQAARAEIPAAGRRHFLVLFDLSFSSPSAIVRAREAAKEMVLNDLHRGDLVAVATYSLQQGPRLVLGFTPDRRQAELAIDTLGLPGIMEQSKVDPLGLIAGELNPAQTLAGGFDTTAGTGTGTEVGGGGGAGARAGAMEAHLRDISLLMGRANRDEVRGQAMAYVGGFEALAGMMANVQGRKYMLLLSEGFDSSILVGTEDVEEQMRMNRAIESGQHQEVSSEERYGST